MKKMGFITGILLVLAAQIVWAQTRYALVIGNQNYQNIGRLANPANDAQDIAAALRGLGYQVDLKLNAKRIDMINAVDQYAAKLASRADSEGFFWYAGHGIQLNGENYLLPVDVAVDSAQRVRSDSYALNDLLGMFKEARNKINIVVLDACRNNPLPNASRGAGTRGLAVVNAADVPQDLIVMYSTAAGDVAADGENGVRNSPFAAAFLKYIASPEPLTSVITDVTNETLTLTRRQQRPFQTVSITQKNYALNITVQNAAVAARPTIPATAPAAKTPTAKPAAAPDTFVFIQGGTFMMGSPETEDYRDKDEIQHRVTVSSFYMGKYEVTQAEYQEVTGVNPSHFKGGELPVESVTWYDAVEYCNKRSEQEGLIPAYDIDKFTVDQNNKYRSDKVKWVVTLNPYANGYRLPTEAEWEYACRAGLTDEYSTNTGLVSMNFSGYYTGEWIWNERWWRRPGDSDYRASGYRNRTTQVGTYPPNRWGLYDMHGNLYEWCWDWYDGGYSVARQENPTGPASGEYRVARGGSWASSRRSLRSANRSYYVPTYGDYYFGPGIRLVRSAAP